jgi:tetratricopeptide (TPR) repeat protein
MARRKVLGCLTKRDLLNSDKVDPSKLADLGKLYLQEDRLSDAIDFFEKANYREGLDQLRKRCVEEGDFFLYQRLAKSMELPSEPDDLIRLADAALSRGKLYFARSAYQQANQKEKLAQVEQLLGMM